MKKIYSLLSIVTLLALRTTFANPDNFPTVQEQLENLNKNWKGKNLEYKVLKEQIPLTDDISLIQMHLSLVEKTLRNKTTNELSAEQRLNRLKCLDILHNYWMKGVFPKNLYHTTRTPYFIDKFGTACAVGQLIISTGYGEFAKKVMEDNNNAYISELNSCYSEINEWATTFGFTVEELSWIQPCYGSVGGTGTLNVSCNGGSNGYFSPSPSGGVPPYTYETYSWNGTGWSLLWCGGSNLVAGYYKCTVTDAMGVQQDYFATITEPPPITQTISLINDNGSCNGSAFVAASGGTPGYSYSWAPGGNTNDTITNLCANTYSLTITDNNGCISEETVTISLATNQAPKVNCSNVTYFTDTLYISPGNNLVTDSIYYNDTLDIAYPTHCLLLSDTTIISTRIGSSDGCNIFTGLSSAPSSEDDTVYFEYPIRFKSTSYPNNTIVNGYFHLLRYDINDTAADCLYPVTIILQNPTGISEKSFEQLHIYPNPTSGFLTFDTKTSNTTLITISNSLGQSIRQIFLQPGENENDISDLTPGLYIIEITAEQKTIRQKIIKE
ncbi:MAG: hypothetical protein K0S44_2251 [Bacteroidetes bacterium]|jgi:hypothetical protein|nr:hypothetical protein [Bacteroidota bacterium]